MLKAIKKLPFKIYLYIFLFIVILRSLLYFVIGRQADILVSSRLATRQQIFARAESSNLTSFFENYGDSLSVLAKLPSIKAMNTNSTDVMESFVEEWGPGGLVGGVILTDTSGQVIYNVNVTGTSDTGASVSERDYFQWAKTQSSEGEYFVGVPVVSKIGATKGETIVPIASPVLRNGVFVGMVASSIRLDTLTHRFTDAIKISNGTNVYLINNLSDKVIHSSKSLPEEGQMFYDLFPGISRFNDIDDGQIQTKNYMVGFSKVKLSGQNWTLVMMSPAGEVGANVVPIYNRIVVLGVLIALTTISLGFMVVKETKKV